MRRRVGVEERGIGREALAGLVPGYAGLGAPGVDAVGYARVAPLPTEAGRGTGAVGVGVFGAVDGRGVVLVPYSAGPATVTGLGPRGVSEAGDRRRGLAQVGPTGTGGGPGDAAVADLYA